MGGFLHASAADPLGKDRGGGGGDGGAAERARQASEAKAEKERLRLEAIEKEEKEQRKRKKRGFKSLITKDRLGHPDGPNQLGGNE